MLTNHSVDRRSRFKSPSRARVASARAETTSVKWLLIAGLMLAMLFATAQMVTAQDTSSGLSDATQSAMQEVISAQIKAFQEGDKATAYSFAAPGIKALFPNADAFVSMVERGYPAVYAPQSFSFLQAGLTPRGPAQVVEFVAQNGEVWAGFYTFQVIGDGRLAISGVTMARRNAQQI